MRTIIRRIFIATILTSGLAFAQPSLILKTRLIDTSTSQPVTEIRSPRTQGRGHLILQFDEAPSGATLAELRLRGVDALQDVPRNGLLVSLEGRADLSGLGVRYAAPIAPSDKVSPLIGSLDSTAMSGFFLVEFHHDVDMNEARRLVLSSRVDLHENPDLNPQHLMIQADSSTTLATLASLDEVGYIFPASRELVRGLRTIACTGALTTTGTTAQSIPTYGDGWDGPGLGSAALTYVWSKMTAQLPSASAQAEIQRAMAEWSKAVQVTWTQGTNPLGDRTVNILWATYDHGDGFPFTGTGGVLAHTFYPAPPNPEPIAGDMHLNDSETWKIGSDIDVFSVTLHELGHALGLGHSDDPTAVMYPYYKMATELSALDISTIQTMYAAQTGQAPTPVATPAPTAPASPAAPPPSLPTYVPMTLVLNTPAATTTAASIALSGSVTGGSGSIVVTWTVSTGSSGTAQLVSSAWTIANVPLASGANTITATAADSKTHVAQSFVVTRQAATAPADTTPPSLTIASPSSSSISTSAASIVFSGVASDNTGVTAVTWSTNTGGAGNASGTTQWTATIPLLVGSNTVLIRATDAAGNIGWRTAVVTRN